MSIDKLQDFFPNVELTLATGDDLIDSLGSVADEEVERIASLEQDEKEKKEDLEKKIKEDEIADKKVEMMKKAKKEKAKEEKIFKKIKEEEMKKKREKKKKKKEAEKKKMEEEIKKKMEDEKKKKKKKKKKEKKKKKMDDAIPQDEDDDEKDVEQEEKQKKDKSLLLEQLRETAKILGIKFDKDQQKAMEVYHDDDDHEVDDKKKTTEMLFTAFIDKGDTTASKWCTVGQERAIMGEIFGRGMSTFMEQFDGYDEEIYTDIEKVFPGALSSDTTQLANFMSFIFSAFVRSHTSKELIEAFSSPLAFSEPNKTTKKRIEKRMKLDKNGNKLDEEDYECLFSTDGSPMPLFMAVFKLFQNSVGNNPFFKAKISQKRPRHKTSESGSKKRKDMPHAAIEDDDDDEEEEEEEELEPPKKKKKKEEPLKKKKKMSKSIVIDVDDDSEDEEDKEVNFSSDDDDTSSVQYPDFD